LLPKPQWIIFLKTYKFFLLAQKLILKNFVEVFYMFTLLIYHLGLLCHIFIFTVNDLLYFMVLIVVCLMFTRLPRSCASRCHC
jgi:hypothetical protein